MIAQFNIFQLLSHVRLFAFPLTAAHQALLSITNPRSLLKPMSIDPNCLILCHPLSSSLQSFTATGSLQMSQFISPGGQSIEVSASASVLPMNIQDWSPLGWTGWISLQPKGCSRVFSSPQFKTLNSLVLSLLYGPTLTSIHHYWKNHSFDCTLLLAK